MRVVLDANVLVRALTRPLGPARAVVDLLLDVPHIVVLSPAILNELRRILDYPRLKVRALVSDEEIGAFLLALAESADVVLELPELPLIGDDADDMPVLQTAATGQADVICTLDRHFQHPEIQRFCAARGIRVLTDIELVTELRNSRGISADSAQ